MAKAGWNVQKFQAIEQELNATYFERREPIRGLLVGLLARAHLLQLGPPGTGKSMLSRDLCERIGGNFFYTLLNPTSVPEQILGPVSLAALEQDSYRRITTHKLPEAHIALLDEIWKGNSAVNNLLLPILNERLFFNDGSPTIVPLEMAVGASNELPEDKEELAALWDRFLLRYVVGYLRDERNVTALLHGHAATSTTQMTLEELAQAQAEVKAVTLTPGFIEQIKTLKRILQEQHQIVASDRRWKQSLDLIRANTWLNGRKQATDADLDILVHALWQDPSQLLTVRQAVMSVANPLVQKAEDLLDEAREIYQKALTVKDEDAPSVGKEANVKLKKITKDLAGLLAQAKAEGKDDARLTEAADEVTLWNREIVKKTLGVDL